MRGFTACPDPGATAMVYLHMSQATRHLTMRLEVRDDCMREPEARRCIQKTTRGPGPRALTLDPLAPV